MKYTIEEIEMLLEEADKDGVPVSGPHGIISSLITQVKEAGKEIEELIEERNALCDKWQEARKQAFFEAADEIEKPMSFLSCTKNGHGMPYLLRRKAEEE